MVGDKGCHLELSNNQKPKQKLEIKTICVLVLFYSVQLNCCPIVLCMFDCLFSRPYKLLLGIGYFE